MKRLCLLICSTVLILAQAAQASPGETEVLLEKCSIAKDHIEKNFSEIAGSINGRWHRPGNREELEKDIAGCDQKAEEDIETLRSKGHSIDQEVEDLRKELIDFLEWRRIISGEFLRKSYDLVESGTPGSPELKDGINALAATYNDEIKARAAQVKVLADKAFSAGPPLPANPTVMGRLGEALVGILAIFAAIGLVIWRFNRIAKRGHHVMKAVQVRQRYRQGYEPDREDPY